MGRTAAAPAEIPAEEHHQRVEVLLEAFEQLAEVPLKVILVEAQAGEIPVAIIQVEVIRPQEVPPVARLVVLVPVVPLQ